MSLLLDVDTTSVVTAYRSLYVVDEEALLVDHHNVEVDSGGIKQFGVVIKLPSEL